MILSKPSTVIACHSLVNSLCKQRRGPSEAISGLPNRAQSTSTDFSTLATGKQECEIRHSNIMMAWSMSLMTVVVLKITSIPSKSKASPLSWNASGLRLIVWYMRVRRLVRPTSSPIGSFDFCDRCLLWRARAWIAPVNNFSKRLFRDSAISDSNGESCFPCWVKRSKARIWRFA